MTLTAALATLLIMMAGGLGMFFSLASGNGLRVGVAIFFWSLTLAAFMRLTIPLGHTYMLVAPLAVVDAGLAVLIIVAARDWRRRPR